MQEMGQQTTHQRVIVDHQDDWWQPCGNAHRRASCSHSG
jgi:hypothetical protein